ncbi:unnamed protein product [Dimorphilus gyrociliatus]|uniref:Uncharacterized protein n=1 Tax=Dimorphilus gyrociliatus TaxID=2664684 RepID=A0A7I8VAT8_9ANNE|nr:unnamed protein product [Dimorphilus gyrociliatus]
MLMNECLFLDGLTSVTGVCVTKNEDIVVSDSSIKPKVKIYRSDGKVLSKLEGPFKHPYQVTSNTKTDHIYVVDPRLHCIMKFEGMGRYRGSFGADNLIWPCSACVDNCGNLLVCDRADRKIKMFSEEGAFIGKVLGREDGLVSPIGVCVDTVCKSGRLAIIEEELRTGGEDRVYLKVFK